MLLSYPAMFVVPAVGLAMLIELFRSGTRRQWLAWFGVHAAAAAALALLFLVSARAQIATAGPEMQAGWEQSFPPLNSAKQMALFLLESHTSEAFAYPAGGPRGVSSVTSLCCLVALVLLVRGRRFWLATLFTVPLALNFIAAALHAYPYTGHSRVALYMAPILCLLTGLGGTAILSLTKNRRWSAIVPAVVALALLAGMGCITSVRDFLKPYKETCWQRNRDFARWFWNDKALDADLICLGADDPRLTPVVAGKDELPAVYFCNQRIYSRPPARCQPPQPDQISKDHPLRRARLRHYKTTAEDEARFQEWLRSMGAKYRLVATERYPLTFFVHESELQYIDQVELYEFVPAAGTRNPGSMVASRTGSTPSEVR